MGGRGFSDLEDGHVGVRVLGHGPHPGLAAQGLSPIPAKNMKLITDEVTFIKQYRHLVVLEGINGRSLFSRMLKLCGIHAHGVPLRGPGIPFSIYLEKIKFTRTRNGTRA